MSANKAQFVLSLLGKGSLPSVYVEAAERMLAAAGVLFVPRSTIARAWQSRALSLWERVLYAEPVVTCMWHPFGIRSAVDTYLSKESELR